MNICLNLNDPKTNQAYISLSNLIGKDAAYLAMGRNNGYPITHAPNGEPSKLYVHFVKQSGSHQLASMYKAQYYTSDFTREFGDWIDNKEGEVDSNGEPIVYSYKGIGYIKGINGTYSPAIPGTLVDAEHRLSYYTGIEGTPVVEYSDNEITREASVLGITLEQAKFNDFIHNASSQIDYNQSGGRIYLNSDFHKRPKKVQDAGIAHAALHGILINRIQTMQSDVLEQYTSNIIEFLAKTSSNSAKEIIGTIAVKEDINELLAEIFYNTNLARTLEADINSDGISSWAKMKSIVLGPMFDKVENASIYHKALDETLFIANNKNDRSDEITFANTSHPVHAIKKQEPKIEKHIQNAIKLIGIKIDKVKELSVINYIIREMSIDLESGVPLEGVLTQLANPLNVGNTQLYEAIDERLGKGNGVKLLQELSNKLLTEVDTAEQIEATIKEIQEVNSGLKATGAYYEDSNTGLSYQRQSKYSANLRGETDTEQNINMQSGAAVGNVIDEIGRVVFSGKNINAKQAIVIANKKNLKDGNPLISLSKESIAVFEDIKAAYIEQYKTLSKIYKVITDRLVIKGDFIASKSSKEVQGIAGELDMLLIHPTKNHVIVGDFKNVKSTSQKNFEDKLEPLLKKWSDQMSVYSGILNKQYGLNVAAAAAYPIGTKYRKVLDKKTGKPKIEMDGFFTLQSGGIKLDHFKNARAQVMADTKRPEFSTSANKETFVKAETITPIEKHKAVFVNEDINANNAINKIKLEVDTNATTQFIVLPTDQMSAEMLEVKSFLDNSAVPSFTRKVSDGIIFYEVAEVQIQETNEDVADEIKIFQTEEEELANIRRLQMDTKTDLIQPPKTQGVNSIADLSYTNENRVGSSKRDAKKYSYVNAVIGVENTVSKREADYLSIAKDNKLNILNTASKIDSDTIATVYITDENQGEVGETILHVIENGGKILLGNPRFFTGNKDFSNDSLYYSVLIDTYGMPEFTSDGFALFSGKGHELSNELNIDGNDLGFSLNTKTEVRIPIGDDIILASSVQDAVQKIISGYADSFKGVTDYTFYYAIFKNLLNSDAKFVEALKANPDAYLSSNTSEFAALALMQIKEEILNETQDERTDFKNIVPSTSDAVGIIRDRLSDIPDFNDAQLDTIYDNYVSLMGKGNRGDKVMNRDRFKSFAKNSNVYRFKDTYIFGQYDTKNNVFIVMASSSPNSKELLAEAIPNIAKGFNVIGYAPKDIVDKYKRSGYHISSKSFSYDFKGEKMDKYMYASNTAITERLIGKPIEELSVDEMLSLDTRTMAISEYLDLLNALLDTGVETPPNYINLKLKALRVPVHRRMQFIRRVRSGKIPFTGETLVPEIKNVFNFKTMDEGTIAYPNRRTVAKFATASELEKLYDFKKVDIDQEDVNILASTVPVIDTKLNTKLANYLSHFGIKVEYISDIQKELGIDSLGTADMLNKIISVDKDNTEELPELAGKFIAYMMQYNPMITPVYKALRRKSRYKNSSKQEILDVIGELLTEQLHKKTDTPLPASLKAKLLLLLDYFWELISLVHRTKINKDIGLIADNVLAGNKALITGSKYKPGSRSSLVRVNMDEALNKDSFANTIVNEMAEKGFILTGSITMAEQGQVLRPNENQVHDLDWVNPHSKDKTKELLDELYPNRVFIRDIHNDNPGSYTHTFLISPKGTYIIDPVFEGKGRVMVSHKVVNESGKVVGTYSNINGVEKITNVAAKAIDLFNGSERYYSNTEKTLKTGKTLQMSNWRDTLIAKLEYSRLKDIFDYNRFIPNEYINKQEALDNNTEAADVNFSNIIPPKQKQEINIVTESRNTVITPNSFVVSDTVQSYRSLVRFISSKPDMKFTLPLNINLKNFARAILSLGIKDKMRNILMTDEQREELTAIYRSEISEINTRNTDTTITLNGNPINVLAKFGHNWGTSNDQKVALDSFVSFVNDTSKDTFILDAESGTGKSSMLGIMEYYTKTFGGIKTYSTSPTNSGLNTLQNVAGVLPIGFDTLTHIKNADSSNRFKEEFANSFIFIDNAEKLTTKQINKIKG